MDLISVIMPTYNAARWVADTIDNLSAQTYPHFELIVADDGSQDDTVAVVRHKLAQSFRKPWRIVELGNNRGPSTARNVALAGSPGQLDPVPRQRRFHRALQVRSAGGALRAGRLGRVSGVFALVASATSTAAG